MDNNVNMDNANNLKPLLAKISEFVLPVESRNATQDSPSEWLDKILDEKLQKYSAGIACLHPLRMPLICSTYICTS